MSLGLMGQDTMVSAAGTDAIGAYSSQTYTFTNPVKLAAVHLNAATQFYVRFNAGSAGLTDWDVRLTQDQRAESREGLLVKTLTIYSLGAVDRSNGDFIVKGWE